MAMFLWHELQHRESNGAARLIGATQFGNFGGMGSPAQSRVLGFANTGTAATAVGAVR